MWLPTRIVASPGSSFGFRAWPARASAPPARRQSSILLPEPRIVNGQPVYSDPDPDEAPPAVRSPAPPRRPMERPDAYRLAGLAVPWMELTCAPVEPHGLRECLAPGAIGPSRVPVVVDHALSQELSPQLWAWCEPRDSGLYLYSDPLPANLFGRVLLSLFKSGAVRGLSISKAVLPSGWREQVAADGTRYAVVMAAARLHHVAICTRRPAYGTRAWLLPA